MQSVADQNLPLDDRGHLLLALSEPKVTLQVARLHAAHKGPEVSHALVGSDVLVVTGPENKRVNRGGGGQPQRQTG